MTYGLVNVPPLIEKIEANLRELHLLTSSLMGTEDDIDEIRLLVAFVAAMKMQCSGQRRYWAVKSGTHEAWKAEEKARLNTDKQADEEE